MITLVTLEECIYWAWNMLQLMLTEGELRNKAQQVRRFYFASCQSHRPVKGSAGFIKSPKLISGKRQQKASTSLRNQSNFLSQSLKEQTTYILVMSWKIENAWLLIHSMMFMLSLCKASLFLARECRWQLNLTIKAPQIWTKIIVPCYWVWSTKRDQNQFVI